MHSTIPINYTNMYMYCITLVGNRDYVMCVIYITYLANGDLLWLFYRNVNIHHIEITSHDDQKRSLKRVLHGALHSHFVFLTKKIAY